MKLTRTFTTQETEQAAREHVGKYLQSQGYEQQESEPLLNSAPLLVYERGSRHGSMFSITPERWRVIATVQTTPNADQTTSLVVGLDIYTTGQSGIQKERDFADREMNGLAVAANGQETVVNASAMDMASTANLERRLNEGAKWFYWIAGLSLVNTIVLSIGGSLNFLIGLGITQFVDGFCQAMIEASSSAASTWIRIANLAINLVIAGLFVLFGFLAKRHRIGFIFGMIIYFLDGLIFLFLSEYLSFGFHLFALYGIYQGLAASAKLGRKADV